ncbi:hypothetical protein BAUCODRAFT_35753, partial [Baudoinia panamericana UAMH 10762]
MRSQFWKDCPPDGVTTLSTFPLRPVALVRPLLVRTLEADRSISSVLYVNRISELDLH